MAKGQIWSYDLLIAVVVFIFLVALIAFFWLSISSAAGQPEGEELAIETSNFADVLMSPGNPSDWEDRIDTHDENTWATISLLGIMESFDSPEISHDKALALLEMNETDYGALKAKFRTNYNFYVEMKEFYDCASESMQNSPFNCSARGITPGSDEWNSMEHFVSFDGKNFTLGINPDAGNARSASVSNRFAIYNNSIVRVKVVLWTNQTWQ